MDKQVKRKRGTSTSLDDDSQNDLDEINNSFKRLRTSENKSVEDEDQDTGVSTTGGGAEASQHALHGLPGNGSGWVELFVRDITSAYNMDDAKTRASKLLEVLRKSIRFDASMEVAGNSQQENVMLKQQSEKLIRENAALKRAVNIQNERYDGMTQQLRMLQVDNYALAMQLRRATKNNSESGRLYPGDLLSID
ncbi:uncharacterized protein LOC113352842 [Papaver somniferum]|uniref:uncharacterized protein LOC113352842 n=1 Tax=Papaver somniferum TaxID=3469 RepID=UPI000E6F8751|nr:uncharacterized protein LOC113352842 [Papaver somniferum]